MSTKFIIGLVIGGLVGYHYGFKKATNQDPYEILDRFLVYEQPQSYERPSLQEFLKKKEPLGESRLEIALDYR